MREILYIQAGSLSNHIGTHFWNAQESYFSYGNDDIEGEEPLVEHDRSFREGANHKVRLFKIPPLLRRLLSQTTRIQKEQTYCPRLLLFDKKGTHFNPLSCICTLSDHCPANFGNISALREIEDNAADDTSLLGQWCVCPNTN